MYSHIFFDLDGTLANTLPLIESTYDELFRRHRDIKASSGDAMRLLGMPLREILMAVIPDVKVEDYVEEYMEIYREKHERMLLPYPGISEALAELHENGIQLGVVTSKLRETTVKTLATLDIIRFFDVIVSADDVKAHKPSPDPILKAVALAGTDGRQSAYVGDSPFDIRAAKAAKVFDVAVTWGAFSRAALMAEEPSIVIDEPKQLEVMLR
jgi:pyrophosphatase PpaX